LVRYVLFTTVLSVFSPFNCLLLGSMIQSLIVAVAEDGAIGQNNSLPWHLPDDLKFFKRTTLGKPVLMGRKTFQSLGKPLPGRLNVVLSSDIALQVPDGVLLFQDVATALLHIENTGAEEVFIIGGGNIFNQTIQNADKLYITKVHTTIPDADTFFAPIDHTHWKLVWEEPHTSDEKHLFSFTFQLYEAIQL
jgi:dihydrofolate reductase